MPRTRDSGRSTPLGEEPDRAVRPPDQAEVERAIGLILERLKPRTPATGPGRTIGRTGPR